MEYCQDCGSKVFNGKCVNCHEELYILDQYYEQGMPLPDGSTEFMKKVYQSQKEINDKA